MPLFFFTFEQQERAIVERVLAQGPAHGLRVLAACTDPAVAGDVAPGYPSRVVYGLPDEETSVRVLGSPDAAGLAADGGMLVRLAGRAEVIEAYQLRVLDEDLAKRLGLFQHPGVHGGEKRLATDKVHLQGEDAEQEVAVGAGHR